MWIGNVVLRFLKSFLLTVSLKFCMLSSFFTNARESDEAAANLGNWMWLSCTAFFHQYYRCYSPVSFGKKWDPDGQLIRRYCPELSRFDKKYIFEPWKAPISDQKQWRCRVTGTGMIPEQTEDCMSVYPKPMFDFDERRAICLDKMRRAYEVGIHGDDTRLREGSWRDSFASILRPEKRQKRY